jgi:hypothetical protein
MANVSEKRRSMLPSHGRSHGVRAKLRQILRVEGIFDGVD